MSVVIIDYGSGNLHSVQKAFEVMSEGTKVTVSSEVSALREASHIVLPGVGAFGDCAKGLGAVAGLKEALETEVRRRKKPFLGICVGMQLLFERGFEFGEHQGLGWLKGDVVAIQSADARLKIPHMGWNELEVRQKDHPLMTGIEEGDHAYFVHSFHAVTQDAADCIATTNYGQSLCAVVGKDNIMGTQFHPEKSHRLGLKLLHNFLAI